eukprot:UN11198
MPNLCDHGEIIINAAVGIGIEIEALPGATAFVPALVASGIRTRRFVFEGQLPRKKGRPYRWAHLLDEKRTIVFYEEPDTLIKLLEELTEHFGRHRQCVIAQDISHSTERYIRGTLGYLLDQFSRESGAIQGRR